MKFLSINFGSPSVGTAIGGTPAATAGKQSDESLALKPDLLRFGLIVAQLGLLLLVTRQFQIESSAFFRIMILAFAGFCVQYFLPLRWRLPFFTLLSLVGITVVFGAADGLWLIGLGSFLIVLCHLPFSLKARVALLLAFAGLLAVLRKDLIALPWSYAIWPILGSMFMFRLIIYLYDIEHDKKPTNIWQSVSYFFMLPNVCFPMFPVIDYKTYCRNYFDEDQHRIYEIGIRWMLRGIIHLILYRTVYYYMTIAPHDVVDLDTLVRYLVSNFLLYFKISGYFHLIIGMLYMFGFRLPETHHKWVLMSSFTDFWRRINIYWKDFMMKIFYYPVFFRLRKLGTTKALVIATCVVFTITWAGHSYQWFWLRGTYPISSQDTIFWTILCVFVIVNSLRELKYGRKRSLSEESWSLRERLVLGVKTVATFMTIVVLWSIWTIDSWDTWFSLWTFWQNGSEAAGGGFPTYLVATIAVIFLGAVYYGRTLKGEGFREQPSGHRLPLLHARSAAAMTILLALAAIGLPQVYTKASTDVANVVTALRQDKLSRLDAAALERGYYEELTRVDRFNSQLWEVYMSKPLHWLDVESTGLTRYTGDFLDTELVPMFQAATSFSVITTNRWGMRDQDYPQEPAEGTYRIAMLGASSVMGWGVEDDETFEAVLEEMLNQSNLADSIDQFEILNFGVPGHRPPQLRAMLDNAMDFAPDAVFYVAGGRELSQAAFYLQQAVRTGVEIPFETLKHIAEVAEVSADDSENEAIRKLKPYEDRILEWIYQDFAQTCRDAGIVPVHVFLPQMTSGLWLEEVPAMLRLVEEAGFVSIDLSGMYDGLDTDQLVVAPWDAHPNAAAHRLIAQRILDGIIANQSRIMVRSVAAENHTIDTNH